MAKRKINKKVEICCKNVLQRYNIPDCYVAFGGYAEDAQCIEKTCIGYIVYYGYHGRKTDKKWNLMLTGAARRVIRMFSESDRAEEAMLKDFDTEIKFYNL